MKSKRSLREYFRNYRFHSIFWKNLMLISCVVLLPFLVTVLISSYTYDELQKNETQSYSKEIVTRVSKDIDNLVQEARTTAVRFGFDNDVRNFVLGSVTGYYAVQGAQDITSLLTSFKISKSEINNIFIYSTASDAVISTGGKTNRKLYWDKDCIDSWDPEGGVVQIRYLPAGDANTGERIAFYFIPGYAKGEKSGVIAIVYDLKKLESIYQYSEDVDFTLLYDGWVIFDSAGVTPGTYVDNPKTLLDTPDDNISILKKLEEQDLMLALHVDSSPLREKLSYIRSTTVALVIVAMVATVLVVFYISRKIYDPISDLLTLLEENQDLEENGLLQTKDEIGYIRHMMNMTISKNKDIEEELSRRIKLLKKAQAVALQAQINPHFMYNTIDTINWMAIKKIGKENEVSQMLNILSQLLRYSLGNTDTFVTLEEEINYTKKYLLVQQIRCNYGFEVFWDIPEELGKCKVIKMILQPVVENAIRYGIKPFGDGGSLEIRVRMADETVCISVSDSGFGLSQEETEEINRVINSQVIKESDHIGLSNVNQRINLMFGDAYGVVVRSKINQGTTVDLTIPYLQ